MKKWRMLSVVAASMMEASCSTGDGLLPHEEGAVVVVTPEMHAREQALANELPSLRQKAASPDERATWMNRVVADPDYVAARTAIMALEKTDDWALPLLERALARPNIEDVARDTLWKTFPNRAAALIEKTLESASLEKARRTALNLIEHGATPAKALELVEGYCDDRPFKFWPMFLGHGPWVTWSDDDSVGMSASMRVTYVCEEYRDVVPFVAGDVVRTVNGTNVYGDYQLGHRLLSQSRVQVEVQRGDSRARFDARSPIASDVPP